MGGVQAAPAVRVGYSWASNNLRLIQTYTTMSCLLFVSVNLILGQAQLVVRSVRAARFWPARRYPATGGLTVDNLTPKDDDEDTISRPILCR